MTFDKNKDRIIKNDNALAITKVITNGGFGNIIEASSPAYTFMLVDS